MESICPRCNAIWGMEEMAWNRCFACGWPDEPDTDGDDDYDPYRNYPQNRPMPHPGSASIDKMGYQPVPDITCPYCDGVLFTDDGLDKEGFLRGDIYCTRCNKTFHQAYDIQPIDNAELKGD